jgi:hypothetical protein
MLGASWATDDGSTRRAERFFQVVTMRNGKIVDIQGCRSRRQALKHLHGLKDSGLNDPRSAC